MYRLVKFMGFGISIMLAGIYIHIEPGLSQNLQGNEFFIVLIGFTISIISLFFNEKND